MKLLILKFSFILILLAKDKEISETLIDLIIYTFKKNSFHFESEKFNELYRAMDTVLEHIWGF